MRIIVGFPAGGAGDIQARMMGQWLSDRLGQQFIVENRARASGNIEIEAVAKAPPGSEPDEALQCVSPEGEGFKTTTPKVIAGVRKSAIYRLKQVQRVRRKTHSPCRSEAFLTDSPGHSAV